MSPRTRAHLRRRLGDAGAVLVGFLLLVWTLLPLY